MNVRVSLQNRCDFFLFKGYSREGYFKCFLYVSLYLLIPSLRTDFFLKFSWIIFRETFLFSRWYSRTFDLVFVCLPCCHSCLLLLFFSFFLFRKTAALWGYLTWYILFVLKEKKKKKIFSKQLFSIRDYIVKIENRRLIILKKLFLAQTMRYE